MRNENIGVHTLLYRCFRTATDNSMLYAKVNSK